MKQFMLGKESFLFNEADKTYTLWFGNRTGLSFKSKRFGLAFIADTNRFLTSILVELNIIYKLVFCEYRDNWFLMYNFKNGKYVNQADTERRIEKSLNDVQDQFTRAGNSFKGSSSTGWSFRHIENICMYLGDAVDLLMIVNKKRNNTINFHNLYIHKKNIDLLADKILKYPDFLPDGCVSVAKN